MKRPRGQRSERRPATEGRGTLSPVEQDLVLALADGSLTADERVSAEARVLASPAGREALERQRHVAALVGARTRAPRRLQTQIATQVAGAKHSRRLAARPWVLTVGGAAAVFAVVLALVFTAEGGTPTVAQAAELGAKPATAATPAMGKPGLLDKNFEGVSFPDWSEEFGWNADGARSDSLEGREAETVFYGHEGHRIGYTVVSGDPLELPDAARHVTENDVDMWVYKDGPRDVAVFERDGQTCILSGEVIHATTLERLASWKAGGAIDHSGTEEHHH
jgi:hypothetical protein